MKASQEGESKQSFNDHSNTIKLHLHALKEMSSCLTIETDGDIDLPIP